MRVKSILRLANAAREPQARIGRFDGALPCTFQRGANGRFSGMFDTQIPIDLIALRLGLAALFGAIIGIDREWRNKPAGIRTHMMVALAAAAFTVITMETFEVISRGDAKGLSSDPLRLVEAITAGVAFLGAGAIIQSRGNVEGITTGSGIWLAGAVGYAAGAGYFVLAAIATTFAVIILAVLGVVTAKVAEAGAKNGAADGNGKGNTKLADERKP